MRWRIVTAAVFAAVLFMGSSVLADGLFPNSKSTSLSQVSTPGTAVAPQLLNAEPALTIPTPPLPPGNTCTVLEQIPYSIFGPACQVLGSLSSTGTITGPSAAVAAQNIMTALNNYLNITNSEVANLNATFQELLSYYSSRAEAVVPYFLGVGWNQTVYDQIAVDSGLVPSVEGLELAFAKQQYQDWNATAASWDLAFGAGGTYPASSYYFSSSGTSSAAYLTMVAPGGNFVMSMPFEFWTTYGAITTGATNPTYFNMAPGGTIVVANVLNASPSLAFGNYTVYDLTKGTQFYVPFVNYTNWQAINVPIESTVHNIGQFDLLKLVCNFNCAPSTFSAGVVETSGAYAFVNQTTSFLLNNMIPRLQILTPAHPNTGVGYPRFVPQLGFSYCLTTANLGHGPCGTSTVLSGGTSIAIGSGPGSVVAGNNTLWSYAQTAQSLVNNSMTMAYDYYVTLRVITQNGTYALPSTCAIPTPSSAFPASTNYLNYQLSAANVEVVYLAYLNAVARGYGQVFTDSVDFCGSPNLGFTFNWTSAWSLALNISASVYIGSPGGPLYLNGTSDPSSVYSNQITWPVLAVRPSLLYPAEYQLNVPVGQIFPLPVNDPIASVFVNYPGNLYYGQNVTPAPLWGIPTYAQLGGYGNYVNVSGQLSSETSGVPVQNGDAIYIQSCTLNGFPQNPCVVSVTYFNSFTFGHVHAITPSPSPGGGVPGLSGLGSGCGFGSLNSWYDGWAGYLGAAVSLAFYHLGQGASGIPIIGGGIAYIVSGLGCILGWIVVILAFALIVYIVASVFIGMIRSFGRKQRQGTSG